MNRNSYTTFRPYLPGSGVSPDFDIMETSVFIAGCIPVVLYGYGSAGDPDILAGLQITVNIKISVPADRVTEFGRKPADNP